MKKVGNIIQGTIEASKVVYLIVAALVGLGMIGLLKMSKDEFPSVSVAMGLVAGVMPGADAAQVQAEIAEPLEELLINCPNVNRTQLKSVCKDGICYIYVPIDAPASEFPRIWTDIRFKVQTRKLTLSPNVLAVVVLDDFTTVNSLLISLESSDKGWSEMAEYAEELKEKLLAVADVSRVEILGKQEEEVAVTIDMDRLSRYGVNPTSLQFQYILEGIDLPAGLFKTEDIYAPINVKKKLLTENDIRNHVVFKTSQQESVRLGDIADVETRMKQRSSSIKFNGNNTLLVAVSMKDGLDIVNFGNKVEKVLKSFQNELPASVHLTRVTDQPKIVYVAVLNFLRDLIISILVVIFVMLILFPLKPALIASSGVPVCTAVAVAIMFVAGIPLNTVTLAALIVVLGMIVDDSIITIDGYMDKIAAGHSRVEAAMLSARELFSPMLMATLSIALMFFPMLVIVKGQFRDILFAFPWVILIALLTSLAYAVLVVPSLEVKYIKAAQENSTKSKFAQAQEVFFNALQKIYDKAEKSCFNHHRITLIVSVLSVVAGIFIFTRLNLQLLPKASRSLFIMDLYMDPETKLSKTQERADSVTAMIMADPRVSNVTTFVGASAPRFMATYAPQLPGSHYAQFIINTPSESVTEALVGEYEDKFENYFTDAVIRVKQIDYAAIPDPFEIAVRGKDRMELVPYADSILAFLRAQDDLVKYAHHDCPTVPSVNIDLNYDMVTGMGINPSSLSLSLARDFSSATAISMAGISPVSLYSEFGLGTERFDELGNKTIRSVIPGVQVPLRQIADIEPDWKMSSLTRLGGTDQTILVSADLKKGKSFGTLNKRFRTWMKENMTDIQDGITIEERGSTLLNKRYGGQLALSLVFAIMVLLLFLLINFKKISISLLIIVQSLFCLLGSFLGLWIFGLDFGMTAILGLISLIGIIVRNGIIMYEYAEELHNVQGLSIRESAMLAGSRRMRPIFLTSCTTALGVLPMIISQDALWMPMGVVICFGVLFTLPLIVLTMPVIYWRAYSKLDKQ